MKQFRRLVLIVSSVFALTFGSLLSPAFASQAASEVTITPAQFNLYDPLTLKATNLVPGGTYTFRFKAGPIPWYTQ